MPVTGQYTDSKSVFNPEHSETWPHGSANVTRHIADVAAVEVLRIAALADHPLEPGEYRDLVDRVRRAGL